MHGVVVTRCTSKCSYPYWCLPVDSSRTLCLISLDDLPLACTSEPKYVKSYIIWKLFSIVVCGNTPTQTMTLILLLSIESPLLVSSTHLSNWFRLGTQRNIISKTQIVDLPTSNNYLAILFLECLS